MSEKSEGRQMKVYSPNDINRKKGHPLVYHAEYKNYYK